jgi:hypothetical protein
MGYEFQGQGHRRLLRAALLVRLRVRYKGTFVFAMCFATDLSCSPNSHLNLRRHVQPLLIPFHCKRAIALLSMLAMLFPANTIP